MTRAKKSLMFLMGLIALAGLAAWQGTARVRAQAAMQETVGVSSEDAQVVAVTFASAWCGPCKILQPRLTAIRPEFADAPVRFLTLDFTMGESDRYMDVASAEGFGEAYQRFRRATGFTVLVDRNTGEVLDVLTADYSKAAMKSAVHRALTLSSS